MYTRTGILFLLLQILTIENVHSLPTEDVIKGTKPFICGLHEVPTSCVEPCLPTCDIPKRPPCSFRLCLGGCICEERYIRESENGKCVPIESCVNPGEISRNYTKPCGKNEEVTECADACQATCDVLTPPGCTMLWCPKGCICKKGYVREKTGGVCVLKENCKKSN
ncbi:serine protease inhibitor swm-1-like [Tribolium madens]|uniref:serine protease inhibitor swm-1-like n=1 Tax=Tribolium madens TaxID=41895 RepID=UPI001CF72088|nr:serine protease inhibitor swm-1-like [Tribolium madens]